MPLTPIKTHRVYSYIRFSLPRQAQGDSLARQTRAAAEWAERHGLVLDDTLCMADLGRSAYKGDHLRGALGAFLALVRDGMIPRGSYLLVENLDRLSRASVRTAFNQLGELVEAGIKVVTLSDGRIYDKANEDDLSSLMISLAVMHRAHEESEIKSKRGRSVWAAKRAAAARGEIITQRLPTWLKMTNGKIAVDRGKAAIVKRIFALYLSGIGTLLIARKFNREGVPTLGKSTAWHHNCVTQLLRSPCVVGRLQAKTFVGRKRTNAQCIEDYYPAIVELGDYEAAQQRLASGLRKGAGGGTKNNNLLTKMAYCGNCGGTMYYKHHSKNRGTHVLVCGKAMRGAGCKYQSWLYQDLERLVLDMVAGELQVSDIVRSDNHPQIVALSEQLESLRRAGATERRKAENTTAAIEAYEGEEIGQFVRTMKQRHDEALAKATDCAQKIIALERQLDLLNRGADAAEENLTNIKSLVKRMAGLNEDERAELRGRLRMRLSNVIERVDVWAGARTMVVGLKGDRARVLCGDGVDVREIESLVRPYGVSLRQIRGGATFVRV